MKVVRLGIRDSEADNEETSTLVVKVFACFFCRFESAEKPEIAEHFFQTHQFGGGEENCVFCRTTSVQIPLEKVQVSQTELVRVKQEQSHSGLALQEVLLKEENFQGEENRGNTAQDEDWMEAEHDAQQGGVEFKKNEKVCHCAG